MDVQSRSVDTRCGLAGELDRRVEAIGREGDTRVCNGIVAFEFEREQILVGVRLLSLCDRVPGYMEMLRQVMERWQGSGKHAAWLLVESAFYKGMREDTAKESKRIIFNLLSSDEVNSYGKYRLLHHLVKLRRGITGNHFRLLDRLTAQDRADLTEILPSFIKYPAFELNIAALYALQCLGRTEREIAKLAHSNSRYPNAEPIRNALSCIMSAKSLPRLPTLSHAEEPDDVQPPY